jgi:hypothetical protein
MEQNAKCWRVQSMLLRIPFHSIRASFFLPFLISAVECAQQLQQAQEQVVDRNIQ